jgi:hypothetical protein
MVGEGRYLRTVRSVLRDATITSSTSPNVHNYPLGFVYAFHDRVGSVTLHWACSNACGSDL